ncbi:MAG: hypothetical protein K2J37_06515 [Ruminococcus sp.]|nr:hypothetical protein [Ruminococcus sp.]MDE6785202.1 hypothetical protein [Ruminococcus sp.]
MTELKNFLVKIIITIITVSVLFRISVITSYSAPYDVYNYDKWGEAVPSQAGYSPERSVSGYDLGAGAMDSPADIFYAYDDRFYIADTGNNRIIAVDSGFEKAVRIYDSFRMPDGTETYLKKPSGIYVSSETELMYIADTENSRVLISDTDGNFISAITKPDDVLYDEKRTFMPQRVIADKAGNIYIVLSNITTGAAMFDSSGKFSGFYGANRVQPTAEIIRNYFSSLFMSDDKRSRRVRNIPAGITSMDIDGDFIFTCTASASQKTDIVKKLNSAGINIFADMDIVIGDYAPVYDISQNKLLAPSITDIDIDEDGNINCLDSASGRIFQYDEDCNLLFIFGTNSDQTGGFRQSSSLESHSGRIYVTDSQKDTVTIFRETEFGEIVHKASALHNGGFYEEALEPWIEVLNRDGNYRRAYLGVAAAKLRAGEYRESMKYAKIADSSRIYNKAFEGWRLEFMKKNSGKLALLFLILAISLIIWKRIRKAGKSHGA